MTARRIPARPSDEDTIQKHADLPAPLATRRSCCAEAIACGIAEVELPIEQQRTGHHTSPRRPLKVHTLGDGIR
jgi:hypothetical protein